MTKRTRMLCPNKPFPHPHPHPPSPSQCRHVNGAVPNTERLAPFRKKNVRREYYSLFGRGIYIKFLHYLPNFSRKTQKPFLTFQVFFLSAHYHAQLVNSPKSVLIFKICYRNGLSARPSVSICLSVYCLSVYRFNRFTMYIGRHSRFLQTERFWNISRNT